MKTRGIKKVIIILAVVMLVMTNYRYVQAIEGVSEIGIKIADEKNLTELYEEAIEEDRKAGWDSNKKSIDDWVKKIESRITRENAIAALKKEKIENPTAEQIATKKQKLLEDLKDEYDTNMSRSATKVCAYLDAYFQVKEEAIQKDINTAKQIDQDTENETENLTEVDKAKKEFNRWYEDWEANFKNKTLSEEEKAEKQPLLQQIVDNIDAQYEIIKEGEDPDGEYEQKWNAVHDSSLQISEEVENTRENIVNNDKIYHSPNRTSEHEINSSKDGVDEIIDDAESFLGQSTSTDKAGFDTTDLQTTVSYIYNIFLQVGVGLSVVAGMTLGIRFMLAGLDEKAEVKKMLVVYVIACVVIFGSFGIWKIAVQFFENI